MGKLYLGTREITPILSSNNSSTDWGDGLEGAITTDAISLCAPYKCAYNNAITSFTATNATTVNSLYSSFQSCPALTSVSFPSLITVKRYGMNNCFNYCTALTSVSFPLLETIESYGMYSCFYGCRALTSITFTSLSSIGEYGFGDAGLGKTPCFNVCPLLEDVYFPALTTTSFGSYTNQFEALFGSGTAVASGTCTVHFPSNLESTIQGLSGYPLFGGTNGKIVLAFDLPATS